MDWSIYQKNRRNANKLKAFEQLGNKCAECGSTSKLEIDHIDSSSKDELLRKQRIGINWTWSWERINKELKKCQLLCNKCHTKKTSDNKEHSRGSKQGLSKLTEDQVIDIRKRAEKEKRSALAKEYGVTKANIDAIVTRRTWKHI